MTAPAALAPTLAQALYLAVARLARAGVDTPALDARVLLREALGTDEAGLILALRDALAPADAARFDALLSRRERREPVALILGRREFWSRDFAVTGATLVPRPDSEILVAAAIEALGDTAGPVLDLGTGSGCLLLSILAECPRAHGIGIDRSEAAIRVARSNALALGLADRARFVVGDWSGSLASRYRVIVANPPYLTRGEVDQAAPEIRGFEPRAALDGGCDGLSAYRALITDLPRRLARGGRVLLEVGAGQARAVEALLRAAGVQPVGCLRDLGGVERCVAATLPAEVSGTGN